MSIFKSNRQYEISDHYDGKIFYNPWIGPIDRSFLRLLKFLREAPAQNRWPAEIENRYKPAPASVINANEVYITYINHATHLIQLEKTTLLTDPIFSKRAGPLGILGPKRVREPALTLTELPPIQVVVISHNHYDHMDLPSLKKLDQLFQPLFLVPLGNKKYLQTLSHVKELDWWQSEKIDDNQQVTLVPAQHWSMRHLGDAYQALWGGYWIQSKKIKIYFAGDTGFGPHFGMIREKLGSPDISLLPIGSYEPRWFMKIQHINPEEAVRASLLLGSKVNIANHHLTFKLSYEGFFDALTALHESVAMHGRTDANFLTPDLGETTHHRF